MEASPKEIVALFEQYRALFGDVPHIFGRGPGDDDELVCLLHESIATG